MKRIFIAILLCSAFAFQTMAIDTSAKSAILLEARNRTVLYEKNAYEKRPIASTTKIMTAILAIENGDLEDVVEVKPEQVGIEGTSIYLKEGERISVKTLLYGLMLKSGNDAAETLAQYVSGDIASFVKLMNEKANILGMENTNFANPHGLPDDNHYSTAYDMARLTAYAMKNETFRAIVSSKNYTSEGRSFANHNKLLKMRNEIDGVKTGFTKAAGRCLVSSGEKDGMRLVVVTLADPNDWDDHLKLYDFGFDNFKCTKICSDGQVVATLPIAGNGRVSAVAECDFCVTSANADEIEKKIYLPRFRYAPVLKGDKVGEIRIIKNGETIKKVDLLADRDIVLSQKKGLFEKVLDKIKNG
ncbi:MAG: D-alanyl-D-alanine carboxypeptidase [Clostridia bacterium]|nr:D-alanyl-D-alanine carboxypeptidase [Clostridia bacterium]